MTSHSGKKVLAERLPGLEPGLGGDVTDDDTAALEAEAMALLDRMAGGDLEARRRYGEVAQRLGWPCFGMTWAEWADQVIGGDGSRID